MPTAVPRKGFIRRHLFLWFFLAVQVIFIIWLAVGGHSNTAATHSQLVQACANGKWQGLFQSYQDCLNHAGTAITGAGDVGKGLALAVIFGIWIGVDVVLGIGYGIYRLARP